MTANETASATLKDTLLAGVLQRIQHGHWGNTLSSLYDPFYSRCTELSCQDGCVLWEQPVVVPTSLQAQILREVYEGHIDIAQIKALPRSYSWWLRLDQKTEVLAAHCDACKSTAVMSAQTHSTHGRVPMHPGIGFTWVLVNTTVSISF